MFTNLINLLISMFLHNRGLINDKDVMIAIIIAIIGTLIQFIIAIIRLIFRR